MIDINREICSISANVCLECEERPLPRSTTMRFIASAGPLVYRSNRSPVTGISLVVGYESKRQPVHSRYARFLHRSASLQPYVGREAGDNRSSTWHRGFRIESDFGQEWSGGLHRAGRQSLVLNSVSICETESSSYKYFCPCFVLKLPCCPRRLPLCRIWKSEAQPHS